MNWTCGLIKNLFRRRYERKARLDFFIAMKTLQVTGLVGAVVRHVHAIGGVLIVIGLKLLFKPEWLTLTV